MRRFIVLQVLVVVVGLLMGLSTDTTDGVSRTAAFGMPTFCVGASHVEAPCWISVAHPGVLVFGFGVGLVFYGGAGVGLLFSVGQASGGLVSIGQLSVGLAFFVGQLGLGFAGLGQLAIGGLTAGQGSVGKDGAGYLKWLRSDLDDALRLGRAR